MNHLKRKWIIFQPSILRGCMDIFVFRRDKVFHVTTTSAATTTSTWGLSCPNWEKKTQKFPRVPSTSGESRPINSWWLENGSFPTHFKDSMLEVAGWSWMKRGHYITNLNNLLFFSGNHSISDHRFALFDPSPPQKKLIIHNSIIPNESLKLWFWPIQSIKVFRFEGISRGQFPERSKWKLGDPRSSVGLGCAMNVHSKREAFL